MITTNGSALGWVPWCPYRRKACKVHLLEECGYAVHEHICFTEYVFMPVLVVHSGPFVIVRDAQYELCVFLKRGQL